MSAHPLKFRNNADLLKFIRENEIQFVDLNFTDLRGKWHHTAQHESGFDKAVLEEGVYFDGSSIPGWRDIHRSDMGLRPDITRVCLDPFAAQKTLKIFCDVHDPLTGRTYSRDPRGVARAAEDHLRASGIADTACFGPEAEFFVFDDVRIHDDPHHSGFQVDSAESPHNAGRAYETGNLGHRPGHKGGYLPEAPVDSLSDIRAEMATVMHSMGLAVEKHHHEVAPGQCEIGIRYSTLIESADNIQVYKHAVRNVAASYGRSATFMPKPLFGENGSGMHCHQSLWKNGAPLFAGDGYAGLSETARHYIGGILRHARALNAFTNPTVNSYKRLVPGYEAPVLLAWSAGNRSAACRIPQSASAAGRRVEVRFPDPSANPYLALAAMLMAGLDGIENRIDPGEAIDKNLYTLAPEDLSCIPTACGSLSEALGAVDRGRDFLLKGNVFSSDLIDAYIALKRQEAERCETMPSPAEYALYYSF